MQGLTRILQNSNKFLSKGFQLPQQQIFKFCSQQKEELTIFDKIISKEIPASIVYEDEHCLAFNDVNPQAPVHILLIPKQKNGLSQLSNASEKNKDVLGHLMLTVGQIAREQNLDEGFRVVINDGPLGQQTVYHLHLHILGQTQMTWPPGVGNQKPIYEKQ